jgi:hypothetical protein
LRHLEVLGPVDARKWGLEHPDGFPHALSVEEWSVPDATGFIELSFKAGPREAKDAQTAFRLLLKGLGIDVAGSRAGPQQWRRCPLLSRRIGSPGASRRGHEAIPRARAVRSTAPRVAIPER